MRREIIFFPFPFIPHKKFEVVKLRRSDFKSPVIDWQQVHLLRFDPVFWGEIGPKKLHECGVNKKKEKKTKIESEKGE